MRYAFVIVPGDKQFSEYNRHEMLGVIIETNGDRHPAKRRAKHLARTIFDVKQPKVQEVRTV